MRNLFSENLHKGLSLQDKNFNDYFLLPSASPYRGIKKTHINPLYALIIDVGYKLTIYGELKLGQIGGNEQTAVITFSVWNTSDS